MCLFEKSFLSIREAYRRKEKKEEEGGEEEGLGKEKRTSAVAACALAHDDVASLVVDDDTDTDFGALSFRHCSALVLKYMPKRRKKEVEWRKEVYHFSRKKEE